MATTPKPDFSTIEPAPVWDALLAWYASHGRDLPWRNTRDPYAILVSEIMLQQTQVDRVIPKYHEFLTAYPTFAALASAPTDGVIRAWSPLGYNQRALRLQRIAQVVTTEYAGALPTTMAGLLALPGVGRYTAGALACFALGQAIATVDTNIQRVLSRVFIGEFNPEIERLSRPVSLLALAEAALPPTPAQSYAWNQALMDLGAQICLARAPACERCPLNTQCRTYAQMRTYTLFPGGAALPGLLATRRVAESPASYTADAPKQRPGKKPSAERFSGSNRYYRGRVVAALRALTGDAVLALPELGAQLKDGYGDADEAWLRGVIAGLVRDGLVAWADGEQTGLRLPR